MQGVINNFTLVEFQVFLIQHKRQRKTKHYYLLLTWLVILFRFMKFKNNHVFFFKNLITTKNQDLQIETP